MIQTQWMIPLFRKAALLRGSLRSCCGSGCSTRERYNLEPAAVAELSCVNDGEIARYDRMPTTTSAK